jgi:hypothetical protein
VDNQVRALPAAEVQQSLAVSDVETVVVKVRGCPAELLEVPGRVAV